ncbi:hypothetical protein GGS20DRAFT_589677 [Poronia punctata]|nr:hypothetical protein GGS20DRAFT_589677 [Poronia punctata]
MASLSTLIPSTQATWCKYYYDRECMQETNGGTSFDCANHNSFASSAPYVQCHATRGNRRDCVITRCTSSTCQSTLNSFQISTTGGGTGPCTFTGGAGPWYEQRLA